MSGELHIADDNFEQELLELQTPLAFIDFETVKTDFIPGTTLSQSIPCQWSVHTLYKAGTDWDGQITHDEFLWTGDVGWSPIYAFVESLYYATEDAATILIYSVYERTSLYTCIQLAQNDMDNYTSGVLPEDYLVVNSYGEKIPLMDIAPHIEEWCTSMIGRFYNMLGDFSTGGVRRWLQSPDFHNANTIKYVFPPASAEYSRSAELLDMYGIPINGYEGFRESGQIAKGDECQSQYLDALDRPPREGVPDDEPGHAPFDPEIERQCLIYCCLDTLSMVIIYLAVLEGTRRWREKASTSYAEYAYFDDDPEHPYHSVFFDADAKVFYKLCDEYDEQPYDYGTYLDLVTEEELANQDIRDYYKLICPRCRKLNNQASR